MSNLNNLISSIQNSQRTLFILCGFPYAGKSYIARKILKEVDLVFVSIDDIFHVQGFDWDSNKLPDENKWPEIFQESYQYVKEALKRGKNVLYDSTDQTVVSRATLRSIAKECGATAQVIYIKTPIKVVWKRWEENLIDHTRSTVDKELVQMTINMFEEPEEWECVTVIEN